ncbi:MAG: NAD(P)/FAD-dependent oxidoreductase [Anaerolineales bacterium]
MRIGIVGGGIAGLTAAYRLSQAGHQVTVYEAQDWLGGQAGTFPVGDTRLERFYHHFFHSDTCVLALLDELGLSDRVVWRPNQSGYLYGNHIYDFVTPLDLLRFKPLPFYARVVTGLQTLYLQRFGDWRKLEQIPAREWLLKHGPRSIYDIIWGSLLRSKYGDLSDNVSMAWLATKIQVRRGKKNEWRETLGYLMGSLQVLIDALAEQITSAGGVIHTSAPVEHVHVVDGRCTGLTYQQGGVAHTDALDAVIMTVGSPIALQIAPDLPASYRERLADVRYQGAIVMVLSLNRSLVRNYWLSIPEVDIPLVVALEHTNFIPPEHYGGRRLVYLSNYASGDSEQFQMSQEELLTLYEPALRRLNPAFQRDWVVESWLFRDRYGQPVFETNYSQRMPAHETGIAGLYLANTTQVYPEDRGVNYAVLLGEAIATIVQGGQARASLRW